MASILTYITIITMTYVLGKREYMYLCIISIKLQHCMYYLVLLRSSRSLVISLAHLVALLGSCKKHSKAHVGILVFSSIIMPMVFIIMRVTRRICMRITSLRRQQWNLRLLFWGFRWRNRNSRWLLKGFGVY